MLLRCCVRIAVSCAIIVLLLFFLSLFFFFFFLRTISSIAIATVPSAVINWKSKTSVFLSYFLQRLHNDLWLLFISSSSGSFEDFCLHVDRGYVETPLQDFS